jgi:site-specific DNA-methyltransferase (adenine-specific)
VCVLDVSDAEADAMTLADNAKRLQGRDDPAALVAMATASFERNAPTMIDLGLGADDLDALVKQAGDAVLNDAPGGDAPLDGDDAPRERIEVEEDEAPVDRAEELRAKWQTATGQLWEIPSATVAGGVHRILCGDSTKTEDVARVMGGETAVLLHTDPPYGVDVVGGTHDPRDEKNYQSGGKVENDALSDEDLRMLVCAALANCRKHMVDGSAFYVWYGENRMPIILRAVLDALGMYRQIVVWVKEHFVFGRKDYHYQHEACFYGWVDGAAHRWLGDRKQTSVWTTPPVGTDLEKKLHPTAKPVALPARAIQNHAAPGEIVIEPFSGSGSTMVAAEKTGRLCCAVELSPKYVAVAIERLAALGLTPRLVS